MSTETRLTDGPTVGAGVARLLDDRATNYITRDELEALHRARLELEAYKRAFRAHGVAIDDEALMERWMGVYLAVSSVPLTDEPELPSPYQTLSLAVYAMVSDLIVYRTAGRAMVVQEERHATDNTA